MRHFKKIERQKDKQSVEINQPILNFEVPFYKKILAMIGWLKIMVLRRSHEYYNATQWSTEEFGYGETNSTLATNAWHGMKFTIENSRGELGRIERNPLADREADLWVFNAGRKGAYRVSVFLHVGFGSQEAADHWAPGVLYAKFGINYKPLKRIIGAYYMLYREDPINGMNGWINGSDIVNLNAGDKLSVFLPFLGDYSPSPYSINFSGYVAVNYVGKNVKQISNEVTEWV